MQLLEHIFFESLPLLLIVEAIGMAVALAIHRRQQTSRSRITLLVSLAVCIALIALQNLVVTDREAIRALIGRLAQSVEDGDIDALGEGLDDQIKLIFAHTGSQPDKQAVLQASNLLLQRYDVTDARVSGVNIEVTGDTAKVDFQSFVDVRAVEGQTEQDNYPTIWKLHCVHKEGRWLVDEAQGDTGIVEFSR